MQKRAAKKTKPKKTKTKTKTAPRSKRPTAPAGDFADTFEGLKTIMGGVASHLHVTHDEPKKYQLVTKSSSWRGGPMYFGAVMMGKAYVSYHLMALYVCPELEKVVPAGLKKRKQGKACFNFRAPDAALFAELSELTKAGIEKYRAKNWL